MYQLSDKNLDRLSREASEHVDPELNNAGWENLERLLDKELPQNKKDRRRFFLLLLFIALVCGAGLTYTMTSRKDSMASKNILAENNHSPVIENNSEKTINGGTDAETSPEKINNKNPDKGATPVEVAPEKDNTTAPVKKPVANALDAGKISTANKPSTTQRTGARKKQISSPKNITAPVVISGKQHSDIAVKPTNRISADQHPSVKKEKEGKSNTISSSGNKQAGIHHNADKQALNANSLLQDKTAKQENTSTDKSFLKDKPAADQQASADKLLQEEKALADQQPSTAKPLPQNNAAITDSSVQHKQAVADNGNITDSAAPAIDSAVAAAKPKKKSRRSSSFEIGVTAGPDLSTVKYQYTDKAGFNAGLQLGYNFNDRWSLRSGIIYTRKNYSAKGKDFHPPKDYWTNNYYLHKVEGSCFMLEIPLNISYNIPASQKNKFFVSSGLSTYLMGKETYQYDYTYNGIMKRKDWTNYKNSHFIFSILNVSAGFEKEINKRFSIEAESYAKVPLKGVGFGNMQMSSYGIYFSLIYKPSKK